MGPAYSAPSNEPREAFGVRAYSAALLFALHSFRLTDLRGLDVAQVSNLLYRRFPIGSARFSEACKISRFAGWKPCDTAGWKPALRRACAVGLIQPLVQQKRRNTRALQTLREAEPFHWSAYSLYEGSVSISMSGSHTIKQVRQKARPFIVARHSMQIPMPQTGPRALPRTEEANRDMPARAMA